MSNTTHDWTTPMIHFYEPKYRVKGIHEFCNTISNFWFILIGFQLLRKRSPIAVPLILIGICSTIFHATGTLFWEAMDELSILNLIHSILASLGDPRWRTELWATVPYLLYGVAIYYRQFWIFYLILSVPTGVAVFLLREQAIYYRKYYMFSDMIGCFLIGKLFWYLEQMSYLWPGNGYFWMGHSIWHFCSALTIGHAAHIIELERK